MEFATQLRVLAADSVNVDCKLVNEGLQQDVVVLSIYPRHTIVR